MRSNLKLISFVLLSLFMFNMAFASLSKDEKKRVKQTLKGYKKAPESYLNMVKGYDNKIADLEEQLRKLRQQLEDCQESIPTKDQQIADLEKQLADCKASLATCQSNTSSSGKIPQTGTAFAIQVGYYNFLNLTEYFGTDKYLVTENYEGGWKYLVSHFKDSQGAAAALDDIRKLGIKDAFVVKFVDGKRVAFDIRKDK